MRIARFLRGSGDGVEPDVGEEHESRAAQHAGDAVSAPLTRVRRDERLVVGRVDVSQADRDDQQNDRDLEDHDQVVDARRLLDADHEDGGHQDDDKDGREIEPRAREVETGARASGHGLLHLNTGAPLRR